MSGRLLRKGIWPKLPLLLFLVAAVAGLALLGRGLEPARALTTLTVNSTADADDASPGDGHCDANAALAGDQCTLRAAISEANSLLSGSETAVTIVLPAGTYTLSLTGTNEDSNATGDLDINVPASETLTIVGAGSASTVIDAAGIDRVIDNRGPGSVTLQGVTVRGGVGAPGAGIRTVAGTLTLKDVVVTNNSAGGPLLQPGGGGINVQNQTTTLVIDGPVTVQNNEADANGGGIDSGGVITVNAGATLTVTGNKTNLGGGGGIANFGTVLVLGTLLVTGNTAVTGDGGGILGGLAGQNSALNVGNVANAGTLVVSGNTAGSDGGGIFNDQAGLFGGFIFISSPATAPSIITVSNNTATGAGGGIFNKGFVRRANPGILMAMTVSGNTAGTSGGGVHNDGIGVFGDGNILVGVTVAGNSAGAGGGIYNAGSVNLAASTVSGNTAGTSGGGIYHAGGSTTLTNVTVSGNKATLQDGGGIYVAAGGLTANFATIANNTADDFGGGVRVAGATAPTITASILAGNSAASGPDCSSVPATTLTYSVVQQTLPTSGTSGCIAGTGTASGTDPQLGPLASNGGPVQTHAIPSTSPAIDRVPDGTAPCDGSIATDARGVQRRPGGTAIDGNIDSVRGCDAGAFESTPVDISLSKVDSPDPVNTGGNITYTITVTGGGSGTIATGVVVTDTLPAGVGFVSATVSPTGAGTCSPVGDTVTCNLAAITGASPAPAVTITIVANVTALGGTRTNTVTVAMNEADPAPGNNTASASTTVLPNQPPAPPSMVAIWPASGDLAMITFQAPQGATSYKLESALNFEFTFGVSSTTISASDLAFGNTIFVGLPDADGLTFYYRLSACNQFGCSSTVFAGALAARQFPAGTTEHWNFVMGGFTFGGVAFAWAQNQVSVPGKVSDFNFWSGVQGFGGQPRGTCTAIAPGDSCTKSWASDNPFISVSQAFPPFGEVGIAVRIQ